MPRSAGWQLVHPRAADVDAAVLQVLEPGDHAQQRGLAAAGRADEDGEFFLLDVEVDAVDDLRVAKSLSDGFQFDIAHEETGAALAMTMETGCRSVGDSIVCPMGRQ